MKKSILLLSGLLISSQLFAKSGINFDSPKGGWQNPPSDSQYTQKVNYPASRVNNEGFEKSTNMIAGRITNHPKGNKKPATLIVNGIAMPQEVNDDGSFSRPYSFASGSNSIEIRTKDGQRKRIQFYDHNKTKTRPKLRVILSWDTNNTDLDLHMVTPDGDHSYYGNRVLANGAALDIDVTTGYGPEIFSMPAPLPGTYLVYLNYYGGNSEEEITTANITILTDEGTANEKKQSFRVPLRAAGELTLVKSFRIR